MATSWIRYKDALELYPMCMKTLRKMVNDAHAAVKIGRVVYIDRSRLESYIEAHRID